MKKGLILEGGAMRGMFTAGVIDVLMENGIEFDGAVGVSAGAAFGCNYKSKQIGRVLRYNTKFCNDKRYGGLGVLIKTGNFYSVDFCYKEVPLKHDIFDFDSYKSNPMNFYVVCTDVEKGEAVYHDFTACEGNGFDWIRASASMPLVSQFVEIDGMKLLDGGISDAIPLRFFENLGYDKNILVLTRPKDYRKKKSGIIPLVKIKYRKYPELVEIMKNRHIAYNETLEYIEKKEKDGEILVIRPETALPIKRTEKNPETLTLVYQLGRKVATEKLNEIKQFLEK